MNLLLRQPLAGKAGLSQKTGSTHGEEFAARKRRDDETRGDVHVAAGTFVGVVGTRTLRQTSLVVQPAKAMLARRIAVAAEKRIGTRTQDTRRVAARLTPQTPLTGSANGKLPRKTESYF